MYPYQRTPMGNPYIRPIYPYIVGVYGLLSPRIPIFSPYKYHGYTYVRGTANCPLIIVMGLVEVNIPDGSYRMGLGCLRVHQCKFSTYTPWKTNGLPLKINDWKMYVLLK